jgi:hypothetical protein
VGFTPAGTDNRALHAILEEVHRQGKELALQATAAKKDRYWVRVGVILVGLTLAASIAGIMVSIFRG